MALFCPDAVRRSWRIAVDIVERQRAVRPRNRGSLLDTTLRPAPNLNQPPAQWVTTGVKRSRRETDHSSPPSANLRVSGVIPLLHPMCFYGVRGNDYRSTWEEVVWRKWRGDGHRQWLECPVKVNKASFRIAFLRPLCRVKRWCQGFRSSGMLRCVLVLTDPDVSGYRSAFIFKRCS
jgi:hypothetical protein